MQRKLDKFYKYKQPSFYRFNEDSIRLVNFVTNELQALHPGKKIVVYDAFCGCGVIGIEFYIRNKGVVSKTIFIEENMKFDTFIEENLSLYAGESKVLIKDFFECTKESLTISEKDVLNVVLINPPYFLPNLKREPLDADRRNARFFKTENDFFRINKKIVSLFSRSNFKSYCLFREDMISPQGLINKLNKEKISISIHKFDDSKISIFSLEN
ncbi:MAG: hypothetical protein CME61_05720 [Halobacteriovoraceae bacterium]|nr:hypothetical protein [Halobacteriovoraceae bacterium]